ncbi:hypothetical protein DNTS_025828, partial [Danionella cerebrum]
IKETSNMETKRKMRFSLSLLSEEDLETDSNTQENKDIGGGECVVDGDPMIVAMADMSFHIFDDQPSSPDDQHLNEIFIIPEEADVDVSVQITKLTKEKNNLFMARQKSKQKCFVTSGGPSQIYLEDTMSTKITIFYVMVMEGPEKGKPVTYNKTELCNSKSDPVKSSLVFYMSQSMDGVYHFESALHRGWFIHTVDSEVRMHNGGLKLESRFNIIESDSTSTVFY